MNTERMKLAWARGARLESPILAWGTDALIGWAETPGEVSDRVLERARIHPDDDHLQYGPLSTALRNGAIDSLYKIEDFVAGYTYVKRAMPHSFIALNDADQDLASFFLLFMAELLADEGL